MPSRPWSPDPPPQRPRGDQLPDTLRIDRIESALISLVTITGTCLLLGALIAPLATLRSDDRQASFHVRLIRMIWQSFAHRRPDLVTDRIDRGTGIGVLSCLTVIAIVLAVTVFLVQSGRRAGGRITLLAGLLTPAMGVLTIAWMVWNSHLDTTDRTWAVEGAGWHIERGPAVWLLLAATLLLALTTFSMHFTALWRDPAES